MTDPGHLQGPDPAPDLTARILRMTETLQTSCTEDLQLPFERHRVLRMVGAATVAAGAVLAILGAGAYVVGSAPTVHAAGHAAAADGTQTVGLDNAQGTAQNTTVNAAAPIPGLASTAALAALAWPQAAGGASAHPAPLAGSDLARLRAAGWSCPVLDEEGFALSSAGGLVVDGQPTLRLVMAKDNTTLTLFEQHPAAASSGAPSSGSTDVPVNAATGHRADVDGFTAVQVDGHPLWISPDGGWRAVFVAGGTSYTLSLATGVDSLASADGSAVAGTGGKASGAAVTTRLAADIEAATHEPQEAAQRAVDDSVMGRLLRGLLRLSGMGGQ